MNDEQIAQLDAEQLVGEFERMTFLTDRAGVVTGKLKTEILRRLNYRDPLDTRITALEDAAPVLKEWLENEMKTVDSDTIEAMWGLVHAAEARKLPEHEPDHQRSLSEG